MLGAAWAGPRPVGPAGHLWRRASSWGAGVPGPRAGGGTCAKKPPGSPALPARGSAHLIKATAAAGVEPGGPWRVRGGCRLQPWHRAPARASPGNHTDSAGRALSGPGAAAQLPGHRRGVTAAVAWPPAPTAAPHLRGHCQAPGPSPRFLMTRMVPGGHGAHVGSNPLTWASACTSGRGGYVEIGRASCRERVSSPV